jgi:hypothetical protein
MGLWFRASEQKELAVSHARDEILRLLEVAKSDCKQHNWKKLLLVLKRISALYNPRSKSERKPEQHTTTTSMQKLP